MKRSGYKAHLGMDGVLGFLPRCTSPHETIEIVIEFVCMC
jgi:hypothetical protein